MATDHLNKRIENLKQNLEVHLNNIKQNNELETFVVADDFSNTQAINLLLNDYISLRDIAEINSVMENHSLG
ncbi:hypothetical protein N8083_00765 [Candidatus Pacebacteria bacterium]|nr:hypothetical protein [Candidatus Paceibacterota bacterium]